MGWRGYIDDRHETVFFWSQKAACTTLFNMLADNMPERPKSKSHFHTKSVPYMDCLKAIETRGYRSVIVARHPVSRSISAYFNKFLVYRERPLLRRDDLEPFAQALHDRFCQMIGVEECVDNIISYEQFLATVAQMRADLAEKPQIPINGHWETQVPPILQERGFHYDRIIHAEALDAELGAFCAETGLTYRPRQLNRTPLAAERLQGYLGDRPAREVSGLKFGPENFISEETLARLDAYYRVDFEMLGYPPGAPRR
ncbi:sulfotransferase family 2 domain-containing protein [Rhodobacter maris]|uniref:Sulfotransferase family protein n=1 Tax=Rhodobacter maris TaxID=446682 RepID=A0A285SGD4_9RHOB|nr:sulfotransferase family 2 domain-containing protein [Rhodobacter maris]SOC06440.1 sulfotransferase family protein [Rhodobacter maris]